MTQVERPPDYYKRLISLYHKLTWARALSQNYHRAYRRDASFLRRAIAPDDVGSYEEAFRSEMYMSLWFSTLYIVVEGWPGLRERDPVITALLRSPLKHLLKDFRDATLHPSHWSDSRLHRLIDRGRESAEWTQNLTDAFWAFFRPVLTADRRRRRRLPTVRAKR